jgi:4-hydroxybenzoate polyprenyltransferase
MTSPLSDLRFSQRFDFRAYVELTRLPNLLTAAADVVMGFLFTHLVFEHEDRAPLGLAIAASCCLYAAGVVLNDYFDRELDAVERPERPIPSGRVSAPAAARLGWTLLTLGVLLGAASGWTAYATAPELGRPVDLWPLALRPMLVAMGLAAAIVLYDRALKRTPAGPVGMGLCRGLNVLLGMSVTVLAWSGAHYLVAAALGTYVTGLTWFARREAGPSSRGQLAGAAALMAAGIAMLSPLPQMVDSPVLQLRLEPQRWWILLGAMGLLIGWRFFYAILSPEPPVVRFAVKSGILSIIVLDALACFVVWDILGGAAILALLIPATLLGRWIEST